MRRRFIVGIEIENAAFDGEAPEELARILRGLARDLEETRSTERRILRDYNGNRVGEAGLVAGGRKGGAR